MADFFIFYLVSSSALANLIITDPMDYIKRNEFKEDQYLTKDFNNDKVEDYVINSNHKLIFLISSDDGYEVKKILVKSDNFGLSNNDTLLNVNKNNILLWFYEKNGIECNVIFNYTNNYLRASYSYFKLTKYDSFNHKLIKKSFINPSSFNIKENDIYDLMDMSPFYGGEYFSLNNDYIDKLLKNNVINKYNLITYNDTAYYLQKNGYSKESIYLLSKILLKYPSRTVAYINLGDAYWELKEKDKAINAYQIYIQQMKDKGKEKRIPKKIFDRVASSSSETEY